MQSQNANYDDLWQQVEQFELEGLPESALKVVNTIEQKASTAKNNIQLIKTLLFKSKFALILEENAQLEIINTFRTKVEAAQPPTKNVLEHLLADLYWQYFKQNRYKFYKRTKTAQKTDVIDFRTWDLETLFSEIDSRYKNTLKNGLLLQLEPLDKYTPLLHTAENSKIYRPTLYDYLSQNALEFYKTNETHITKPAYKFEIDNADYFANAKIFSRLQLQSKDSTSLQFQALKIYQNLINFHLKDSNSAALTLVNIERLKYVNANATLDNTTETFINTLEAEKKAATKDEHTALYNFEIARLYVEQSKLFDPKTATKHQWKAKEALDICNTVIANYPKSLAAKNCKALKARITASELNITGENFVPVQQYSKLLVRYKNINCLDFKAYKLSATQFKTYQNTYNKDDKKQWLSKLKPAKIWNDNLKTENDYQTHTTEVVVPKLDNGRYVILANNTDQEYPFFGFATLQATNIVVITSSTNTHEMFQCIDRENGKPIANANVTLTYRSSYRSNTKTEQYTTDHLGFISIEKNRQGLNNCYLNIKTQNETAFFGTYRVSRRYANNKKEDHYKSFLFTDRSIYRSGQTVYFKAIAMKTTQGKSEVLANTAVNATLFNTNGETLKTLEFTTNAYGSVSGSFVLPNNGLNGRYSIVFNNVEKNMYTRSYISVEAYKRPKFETQFDPITDTFKVNDSVTVKGSALAFSGSSITGAKVVYRVHRKVQYPRWYYWRGTADSEKQEITHGEGTTNAKGEFQITFKALPDLSVDKNSLPIFKYEVTAAVTDINGETREATKVVNVGYHALTAHIDSADRLDKTQTDNTITIATKNLNGEFIAAKGTVKIYKLKAPSTVLRPRPWGVPDYQIISKDDHKTQFPHDAYLNEDKPENWEKGALVFNKKFNTKISQTLKLGKQKKWASGQYLILLETTGKFGQLIKDQRKITVYSPKDDTLADHQLFSITVDREFYRVGETAQITLASAAKALWVTLAIEKQNKIVDTQIIQLNNNKKTVHIPVSSEDTGGFAVHYNLAAFNSSLNGSLNIAVPYPETDLTIETSTFRDRLQPNAEETWRFNIKGAKGEKVSSELLASMYDASLDQFKPHNWSFNPLYRPSYYASYRSTPHKSFGTSYFSMQYKNIAYTNYVSPTFDTWNWFGLGFSNHRSIYRSYIKRLQNNKYKDRQTHDNSLKNGIIKGTIVGYDDIPLPGVKVAIKGHQKQAVTGFDGNFTLTANLGTTLVFSYTGFFEKEIVIEKNKLHITLFEDTASLGEAVVIGYAERKRKNILGGVKKIELKEITKRQAVEAFELSEKDIADDDFELESASPKLSEKITTEDDNSTLDVQSIKTRQNLKETAFFFPQLETDTKGNVSFSFTTPEALTQWKLQLLAHTKTLESATKALTTVTQKELMVVPNAPRFLREGDQIVISSKIANLTDTPLSGQAVLVLTDALTGKNCDSALNNTAQIKTFTVDANGNTQVSWQLSIPDTIQAVQYKVIAKTDAFSDGEQGVLPVLSNRMLVTETLPLWIKGNTTKTFTLDKLKNTTSKTLKHHKLTLELTSNPAWYALQALPYLMEYPYECNEQTFSRYYANALAQHVVNSNPRIKAVFDQWASQDALLSHLEKNEDLKSILTQETPWLRDAQSETEQKKRIALLFDLNTMTNALQSTLQKLKRNQMPSGGWSWFKGGRENRWITQHIIAGFGYLKQLNVANNASAQQKMIQKAVQYLDEAFVKTYNNLKTYNPDVDLNKDHLSYIQLHYMYMRSFFPQLKQSKKAERVSAYYQKQIARYWLKRPLYAKGLMALIAHRQGNTKTASKILKSLKENSIINDELGMYWKANTSSWFWHQAPIETQALLIEAFSEIENDTQTVDNLKIWLLKHKQTNRWKTTKATTEAVYALLLQGSNWLNVTDMVEVTVGDNTIKPSDLEDAKVEAGTGYFKTAWQGQNVTPNMGTVILKKTTDGIAWGGLYWQYFEDLDRITATETPLRLKKQLFLKHYTDTGETLTSVSPDSELHVGDLIRIRIELKTDRPMEFVHMKDMRAAGLEPVNVLSKYKWQDGLGYYESTKDAATNFFFDRLPKGVYVFEYDLRVNNAGVMSNGITTIQSMYAPEFSSHSKGSKIHVQ